MTNIYGPIVTGKAVVDAVVATVQMWGPDYIAEVSERSGRRRDEMPMFRSFATVYDLNKFDEDQLPSLVCVAPGTIESPIKHAKQLTARWGVGLAAVVSGQDADNTYELATLYIAAVRVLLLQKPSLGQFADGINWISERYENLPTTMPRTLAAGILQIGVDVNGVADPTQGPGRPSVDITAEPGDWPTIETVINDIEQGVGSNG
jgi:hypothetical protein